MHKGEHPQVIGADLVCIVALLLILHKLRKKNLAELAIRVVKSFPSWRVKMLSECRESDEPFATVLCLSIINAFVHLLDMDSIEWLALLEASIDVKAGKSWCLKICDTIRDLRFFLCRSWTTTHIRKSFFL